MPSERCGAKTRTGGECTQWPVAGARRCRMHGGKTQKARVRAEAQRAMRALGDVPAENVDPAEALLWLVSAKHSEVHWLRSKVQALPDSLDASPGDDAAGTDDALVWGRTRHEQGVGPQGPIDKTDYASEANVWWRLLREAEDQLAKYSTAALRAGVERRQLELQEAQAVHLASAINRILDALELSAEQQSKVPTVVPAVLRSLPMEGGQA